MFLQFILNMQYLRTVLNCICETNVADSDPQAVPTLTLEHLPQGVPAHVHSIGGDPATDRISRRLHELGFGEGTAVQMLHRGPFGGNPLAVRVGSMVVALRKAEAARVSVLTGI